VNNKIESSKQVDNTFESAATVHMGGKNTKDIDNVVEPDNMLTETQIAEQVEIMVGHGLEIRLRSKINGQWKVVKTGLRDRAQAESVIRRMATDMDSLRIDGWKDEEMMASIVVKWGKETEKEGKAQRRVQSYPIYTLAEVEAQLAYERAYEKERCGTHVLLQPQINSEWTMGPGTVASHLESTKLGPPGGDCEYSALGRRPEILHGAASQRKVGPPQDSDWESMPGAPPSMRQDGNVQGEDRPVASLSPVLAEMPAGPLSDCQFVPVAVGPVFVDRKIQERAVVPGAVVPVLVEGKILEKAVAPMAVVPLAVAPQETGPRKCGKAVEPSAVVPGKTGIGEMVAVAPDMGPRGSEKNYRPVLDSQLLVESVSPGPVCARMPVSSGGRSPMVPVRKPGAVEPVVLPRAGEPSVLLGAGVPSVQPEAVVPVRKPEAVVPVRKPEAVEPVFLSEAGVPGMPVTQPIFLTQVAVNAYERATGEKAILHQGCAQPQALRKEWESVNGDELWEDEWQEPRWDGQESQDYGQEWGEDAQWHEWDREGGGEYGRQGCWTPPLNENPTGRGRPSRLEDETHPLNWEVEPAGVLDPLLNIGCAQLRKTC
jgi:hypothetical protein